MTGVSAPSSADQAPEAPADEAPEAPADGAREVAPVPTYEEARARYLEKLFGRRRLALGLTRRDRTVAAVGLGAVTLLAAVLRLFHLGVPRTLVFDETYYVKYAYSLLRVGYEARWPDNPNPRFEAGDADIFLHQADYVVHPPLGKWMIALGIQVGGVENSWSWRLSTAVVGIIAVFLVGCVARRIFASTFAGLLAGLFMAVDGEAIVASRTALLDNFVMFWGLVAFCFIILDREQSRRRLADKVARIVADGGTIGNFGPRLGWRWYRFAAAVALGLMCGTKWSGLYFFVVFGLLSVAWDATARRAVGVKRWWEDALVVDAIPAALIMVPTVVVTYLATWWGWFRNPMSYMRQWAVENPGQGVSWLPPTLRSFWQYHQQMWEFHTHLDSTHPYMANPVGWIVQWRPTSYYFESVATGTQGCTAKEGCAQAVTSLGNPVLWWAGALAAAIALVWLVVAKDWRAAAVLSGIAAGWLPWFAYMHRTIFTFYSIAFTPWIMMAVAYVLLLLVEDTDGRRRRRRYTLVAVGAFTTVVVLVSAYFYPIWTAWVVPYSFWHAHMWLPSWI